MSKGSARRKQQVDNQKFADQWDAIFGIKKDPQTLQDHVWNDKMKDMQIGVDLAMLNGKPTECPKCGADDYESVRVKPGEGDPSKTFCLCSHCGHEFDGKTIWD